MTTAIRGIRLDDVDFVANLVRQSFDMRLWPFMVYCQRGISDFLSVAVRYPSAATRSRFYVSTGAEGIEGFAEFNITGPADALLSYICVVPNARGRGVATKLIQEFLLTHPAIRRLRLDVFTENVPALGLYTKLGFNREQSAVWVSRPLPKARGTVEIPGLAASLSAHKAYGFCELEVRFPTRTAAVGLIGTEVMNCRVPELFQDDTLLAALRTSFPDAGTAFAVVAESDREKLTVAHSVVNRTDRMVLDLPVGGLILGARE